GAAPQHIAAGPTSTSGKPCDHDAHILPLDRLMSVFLSDIPKILRYRAMVAPLCCRGNPQSPRWVAICLVLLSHEKSTYRICVYPTRYGIYTHIFIGIGEPEWTADRARDG